MAERIPSEIFNNTTLHETPQVLAERPRRQVVIDVYNRVFIRLTTKGVALKQDFNNGRFNGLEAVSQRIASGTITPDDQTLINDYRTLLNARVTVNGRRNINAASDVLSINGDEAADRPLTTEQIALRDNYQAGRFHLITNVDHPLTSSIRTDRFTVPARDNNEDFAVIDGAPVEGMINFIDQEIFQTQTDTTISNPDRQSRLNTLRLERDILFTQSTPIFAKANDVTHARNQLEAYYNSQDQLKTVQEIPDWLNAENLLTGRRVLNIPQERGRRRWLGCLPLLLLLPLPLLVSVTTAPCQGTGGNLRVEVFDTSKVSSVSLKGANERELGYQTLGWNQREYQPSDHPRLREAIDGFQIQMPEFISEYLKVAEKDEIQAGQRIRADKNPAPWVNGTEFEGERWVLASCSSPEQRSKKAIENIIRRNDPKWYDGALDLLGRIYQAIPKIEITLR